MVQEWARELWESEFKEYLIDFMSQTIRDIQEYLKPYYCGDKKSGYPLSDEYAREKAAKVALNTKTMRRALESSVGQIDISIL